MLQLLSILFGFTLAGPLPLTSQYIPLDQWEAQQGDRFVVDTQENMGYLVHESGNYTSMRVGSGQRRTVHYLGKTYNATTPTTFWTVKSRDVQGDKITFGKTGRFLRLYMEGDTYTSYGIHATANIDDILASDDRYRSFGCVLVSEKVMDILEETYELNGDRIDVVTAYGLTRTLAATPGRS